LDLIFKQLEICLETKGVKSNYFGEDLVELARN